MEQNTIEWLEMRKNKIGASDAPIIMGVSPYKTPYQLWQEKLDLIPIEAETYQLAEGKRKEPLARGALEQELGMPLLSKVKFHQNRSWQMASLDAISLDERIIAEIKCANKEDHELAIAGKVPEKYFPQLQHQIEVCEVEFAYYFSYHEVGTALVKVYRDDIYISKMTKEEEIFYEKLQNFDAPDLTERDYVENTSLEWEILATSWLSARKNLEKAEALEKSFKEKLISMSENRNTKGHGIKVSKCIRKGNVDYSKIPLLKDLDLEPFRKKQIEFWRLSSI